MTNGRLRGAALLRTCRLLPGFVALGLVPGVAPGQGSPLFVLDVPGTPVGEFPASLKLLSGTLEVALKDGVPMLKATAPSEFLITLPQVLPEAFTLAFDLVPKACCNPDDLAFEGTPTQNRGPASAHVVWDGGGHLMVVGGGEMYQGDMPEELAATLPGVLTSVVAVVQGTTLRLYTNGRRLYTLTDRQFVRGRVLRVFLGGTGEGSNAVYLAGLRITAGTGGPEIVAAEAGLPTPGQTPPRQPPTPPAADSSAAASTGTITSAGSTVQAAGTGTIASTAPTAVTTMTPQTGTARPATGQMTPVIVAINLIKSSTGAVIDLAPFPEQDSAASRVFARYIVERRLTDDPNACPQDITAPADETRCHRSRVLWAPIEDWGLEPGGSYTYRVGTFYTETGQWCTTELCGVAYPSLPVTVTTPALLIGKVEGRTGYSVTSVEPRNVQVAWVADGQVLVSWTGMGYLQANPNVPGERAWSWIVDRWIDGIPSTCPAFGVFQGFDTSNCSRDNTFSQHHIESWGLGSGTTYRFQVISVFEWCDRSKPNPSGAGCTFSYYPSAPVAYQTPVYFTPERPVRGSVTAVPPRLFLQARQGKVGYPMDCMAWTWSPGTCGYRTVDFVWAPTAAATGYVFALDQMKPDDSGWGPYYIEIGVRKVAAGPAPGISFDLTAGTAVRACVAIVGDPAYSPDPRKGECIEVDIEP